MENTKIKKVGINFLHTHPQTQKSLNLDEKHIIVDREEWEQVVDYFTDRPDEARLIGEKPKISATENFMKSQDLIKSIHICYGSTIKIEIKNENSDGDYVNVALEKLLHQRKEVAKAYVEAGLNEEKRHDLMMLFSKYNEEIIKMIGL